MPTIRPPPSQAAKAAPGWRTTSLLRVFAWMRRSQMLAKIAEASVPPSRDTPAEAAPPPPLELKACSESFNRIKVLSARHILFFRLMAYKSIEPLPLPPTGFLDPDDHGGPGHGSRKPVLQQDDKADGISERPKPLNAFYEIRKKSGSGNFRAQMQGSQSTWTSPQVPLPQSWMNFSMEKTPVRSSTERPHS